MVHIQPLPLCSERGPIITLSAGPGHVTPPPTAPQPQCGLAGPITTPASCSLDCFSCMVSFAVHVTSCSNAACKVHLPSWGRGRMKPALGFGLSVGRGAVQLRPPRNILGTMSPRIHVCGAVCCHCCHLPTSPARTPTCLTSPVTAEFGSSRPSGTSVIIIDSSVAECPIFSNIKAINLRDEVVNLVRRPCVCGRHAWQHGQREPSPCPDS